MMILNVASSIAVDIECSCPDLQAPIMLMSIAEINSKNYEVSNLEYK